jgi:hypothetical protein
LSGKYEGAKILSFAQNFGSKRLNSLIPAINADLFSEAVFALEFDHPVNSGKQSIVLANAYIVTGMKFGASLADKNTAGGYKLAVTPL